MEDRITQQGPSDDAIVRCRYTTSAKQVIQILQFFSEFHFLSKRWGMQAIAGAFHYTGSLTGLHCNGISVTAGSRPTPCCCRPDHHSPS
ncbi:hypothetical protein T4B_11255 [Trichinella pseudospiralis]|uniref:Uncharacterized protein n=1 Tax=Trichinella pseudospiralis TaxID=6337 RepID=A0A0V1ICZ4_TRIPS|nr:hypothetical protein T4A_3052 [Trichinella pseudospiralis]KRZ20697.1 hypothetical protein T4B_11255 [Trichinella pseudospiralis]